MLGENFGASLSLQHFVQEAHGTHEAGLSYFVVCPLSYCLLSIQTARVSTGGKAPRKVASKSAKKSSLGQPFGVENTPPANSSFGTNQHFGCGQSFEGTF